MLLILTGCNNNIDAAPLQHKMENSGIKGHFKDFPELESLFDKAMPKNNSGHGKAKAVGIYDFKIDSTFITKRVGPKGTSYTMAIYRDSTYKFIENLIICDRGNFTEAYIMSYFPDSEFEKKENAQYHFIGGMSLAKIDYGKVPKAGISCASVTVTYCDYSDNNTPNTHVAGPNCGTTYNITTTLCHGILTSDYFNPEMQPMQFIRGTRGSGGGSSSNPTPPNSTDFNLTTQPQLTLSAEAQFYRGLSATQKVFWNNTANATVVANIKEFFRIEGYTQDNRTMMEDVIDVLISNPSPIYTANNYPGIDDDMPYRWWQDSNYIKNNLQIAPENPNAPVEAPNSLEVLLFKTYPQLALLHINNSINAMNRAEELVDTSVYTHAHNGKGDAFRHAYWNALDAAEFGAFFTKVFTDAHEWNSGNHPLETAMDFHNNGVGRLIGENYSFTTPDSVIEAMVHTFLGNGDLKYLSPLGESQNNYGQILQSTTIKFTNQ